MNTVQQHVGDNNHAVGRELSLVKSHRVSAPEHCAVVTDPDFHRWSKRKSPRKSPNEVILRGHSSTPDSMLTIRRIAGTSL
jgi:hypothetical protein